MRPIVLLAILLLLAGSASGADPRLIVVPQPIPPLDLAPLQPPSPRSGEFGNPNQSQARTTRETSAEEKRGTDEIPLSIKILPSPDHEAQVKEEQRRADEHASDERGLVYATWYLAAFTLALVIVAGGQIALFFVQLRLIRESLDDAKLAATAAKDGAAAAEKSANIAETAMTSSERAFVYLDTFRWVSHLGLSNNRYSWTIVPIWINTGNTPTRQLNIDVCYDLRETPLPDDFSFPDHRAEQTILVMIRPRGGTAGSIPYEILGEDLIAVRDGKKYFYVWGSAEYYDVFENTEKHITRFCAFIREVTGDPTQAWDEKINPVGIVFKMHDRHNCADEDCDEQRTPPHGTSLLTYTDPSLGNR
jgi:hypothetical protein